MNVVHRPPRGLSAHAPLTLLWVTAFVACSGGGTTPSDTSAPDAPQVEVVTPDAVPPVDASEAGPLDPWDDLAGSGPILNEIVGVASQMSTRAEPNEQRDFEYAQYAPYPGFWMRNGHRFDDAEPDEGDWHRERVSGSVDGAVAGGSRVLMGLDYGTYWAEPSGQEDTLDVDAFAAYAGQMAAWFCDTVKVYEVWNEENLVRFWKPAPDPERYADLVLASAAAIKAQCPDARVIFGGLSSYDDVPATMFDTWGFLRRALAARPALCDALDGVGLHPYTWAQYASPEHDEYRTPKVTLPGQSAMTALARQVVAEGGCAPKPLYFTEVGWPSYQLSESQVAAWAVRSLLLTARDGVSAWCWYTFWDTEPVTTGVRPHEHYFGLFGWVGPDGTLRRPKPAWKALTAGLDRLGRARFARDLGPALGLPDDVFALAFVDDAGAVTLALWDGRDQPDLRAPVPGEGTAGIPAPGGPDTTFDLALPLPDGTTATVLADLYGAPLPSPGAGPTVHLTLTPTVQYLALVR
jgi:hypothetical protein